MATHNLTLNVKSKLRTTQVANGMEISILINALKMSKHHAKNTKQIKRLIRAFTKALNSNSPKEDAPTLNPSDSRTCYQALKRNKKHIFRLNNSKKCHKCYRHIRRLTKDAAKSILTVNDFATIMGHDVIECNSLRDAMDMLTNGTRLDRKHNDLIAKGPINECITMGMQHGVDKYCWAKIDYLVFGARFNLMHNPHLTGKKIKLYHSVIEKGLYMKKHGCKYVEMQIHHNSGRIWLRKIDIDSLCKLLMCITAAYGAKFPAADVSD